MHVIDRSEVVAGTKINDWTLLSVPQTMKAKALARCKCGIVKEQMFHNIFHGLSKRCRRCAGVEAYRRHAAHPESVDRIYNIWQCMKKRIRDGHGVYGRIDICDEWQRDSEAFRVWALASGYTSDLSIDRIDNTKGYHPENCRWSTQRMQARNRSGNKPVEAFGETKLIVEWAEDERCKVNRATLYSRLSKGWRPENAITAPAFAKCPSGAKRC
jgi:hypothetical protein